MKNLFMEKRLAKNIRSCQLIQADLLKHFDRICRKHNLSYWLDGGTLLGAVRHGGFIPWDDDIDVAMPQKDFREFIEIAEAELPEEIFLQIKKTDPAYPQYFAKLININSYYVCAGDDLSLNYKKCIYIDIFEFIDYPTMSKIFLKKLALGICCSQYLLSIKHICTLDSLKKLAYIKIRLNVLKFIWSICCLFPKGKYLACTIVDNGDGVVHLLENIFPLKQIKFEDEMFSCPRNSHAYLTDKYNNYMELPPPEKRISHAIYIEPRLIDPDLVDG